MSVPMRERRLAPRVQSGIARSKPRAFLALMFIALLAVASHAEARRHHAVWRPSASSAAAMAIDLHTGRVLYSKNPDAPRYPASITKVMTLYLLFDALRDGRLTMRTELRVSEHAAEQSPTKLGLRAGDTISVADAIGAIVTRSANDMAVTVAEALAGSEEEFARRMTQKARTIGMVNTTFRNASGLPNAEQVTTAQDLIVLGKSILADHPERSKVFATRYYQYRGEIMRNHNTMLFSYEGMEGMKTGFTSAAGFNLLASAHRGDKRILAVVLGGASSSSRNAAMRNILDSSWNKAMTQMAARKAGIETASLRQPPRAMEQPERTVYAEEDRRVYEEERRAYDERQERREQHAGVARSAPITVAAPSPAPALSQPALELTHKPDAASIGLLVASIQNGMVAKRPLGRPKPDVAASDMTTDEPEEKTEIEGAHAAVQTPDIAQNETLVAQMQPSQIQNVSIHYKTVRVADVQPLDPVALDDTPAVRTIAVEPHIVRVQASGTAKTQAASATDGDGIKVQKLAAVVLPPQEVNHPGPYYVQVGSFPDEAQAAERLEGVKQTLGSALLKAHPKFVAPVSLPSGVTMYRARLARFASEAQAKSTCKKLRTAGIECWDMRAQ